MTYERSNIFCILLSPLIASDGSAYQLFRIKKKKIRTCLILSLGPLFEVDFSFLIKISCRFYITIEDTKYESYEVKTDALSI